MTDNEKLMDIQEKFLNGKSEAWSELWTYSQMIAKRIIISEFKKKCLHPDRDSVEDLSMVAVIYVLRRFREKKDYKVKRNFISAIYFGCIHAIYYRKKGDILEDSLINHLNDQKETLKDSFSIRSDLSRELSYLQNKIREQSA